MSKANRALAPKDEPLPAHVKPLFWDVEFGRLRWPRDQEFITGRVLSAGEWSQVQWLMEAAGRPALRAWLVRRQGRGLDRRTLRFWEVILRLPHKLVTGWIEAGAEVPQPPGVRR